MHIVETQKIITVWTKTAFKTTKLIDSNLAGEVEMVGSDVPVQENEPADYKKRSEFLISPVTAVFLRITLLHGANYLRRLFFLES